MCVYGMYVCMYVCVSVYESMCVCRKALEHTRKTVNSIIKVRHIASQVKKSEKKEIEYQLYLHEKEYPKRGAYRANGPGCYSALWSA